MGKIKNMMLALLGFMTVTVVDAWSLNMDLVNSPFIERLQFSAQKYVLSAMVPIFFWLIIAWRGRRGE